MVNCVVEMLDGTDLELDVGVSNPRTYCFLVYLRPVITVAVKSVLLLEIFTCNRLSVK